MKTNRVGITAVAVFAVMFVYEWLVHSVLLSNIYATTPQLWRPKTEICHHFHFMIAGYVFYALFFTVIFSKGFEKSKPSLEQGYRFGMLMGLLLGPISGFGWYAIMPISFNLAVAWFAACFIENLLLGLTAGLVYKPSK